MTLFDPCLEKVFREAKRRRLLTGRKSVAVDIHEKPFIGESPARCGTTRFWVYNILDIVRDGCRITLAALPITDKKKAAGLVKMLLRYALRWIRIDVVLLDRFFHMDGRAEGWGPRGVSVVGVGAGLACMWGEVEWFEVVHLCDGCLGISG